MTGQEFKKAVSNNPNNIYCLVSTDSAMVDLYVKRFKEAIQADMVSYGQIRPFGKLFKKKTLNVLYMPKLDESVFDRSEYIFIYTDAIDKRSSVYKQHKDIIIELDNNYLDYILKNTDMTEAEAKQLIKASNNDFGCIINNIRLYNDSNGTYKNFTDYSNDVFYWVDCFIKGQQLPHISESPIGVMALLFTNCNNLLRVIHNDTTGMNPYVVKCISPLKSYITEAELIQIIDDCFYLDCQIKKGLIDPDYTLKYLEIRRFNNAVTNKI